MPIEDVLYNATIWIEESRFENNEKKDLQALSHVYGFFVRYYFSDYSGELKIQNADLFASRIMGGKNPLQAILDEIRNWIYFDETILSEYCFDHEIEVKVENGTIYFNRSPHEYYRWKLAGVRYEITRLNYFLDAAMIVEHEEEAGKIEMPKGAFQEDEDMNRIATIKRVQSLQFLSDLKIESLKFGNQQISVDSLLTPLLGYSTNRLFRYELKLDSLKGKASNWQETYPQLFIDSLKNDIENDPWFLMNENKFHELVANVLEGTPIEVKNELTKMFSFKATNGNFDPFGNKYDVWGKPFLKIGEMLFCPMAFLANNDWFYAFAQAGINNLNCERKINGLRVKNPEGVKSAIQMERDLAAMFNESGFCAEHIENHQKIEGDVDLIIEDADDTLFIQLKRTYFKLDLQAQYKESIESDCLATMQLNMAEKSLSKPNSVFRLHRKPIKWYVTTSYEGTGRVIDDCKKVNYFDLLYVLRKHNPKKIKELVRLIESDKVLKDVYSYLENDEFPGKYKLMVREAGFPLLVSESNAYRKPIVALDENIQYHVKLFQEALELDSYGKKKKAIKLFQKCLELYPNDFDALGAVANVYADIGDFENSFLHFEKALEIIPKEPFVGRNYFLALLQGKRYYQGFSFIISLIESYPFLGDLRGLFLSNFNNAAGAALSVNEKADLESIWNRVVLG